MSDLRAIGGAIGELALRTPHLAEALTSAKADLSSGAQSPTFGVEGVASTSDSLSSGAVREKDGIPFSQYFTDALASANQKQFEATDAARAFADGARDDIHGTMISVKEAEIELKLVSNVRTKLVDAWNDLWRMSV